MAKQTPPRLAVYRSNHGFGGVPAILIISQTQINDDYLEYAWFYQQHTPVSLKLEGKNKIPSIAYLGFSEIIFALESYVLGEDEMIQDRIKVEIEQLALNKGQELLKEYLKCRGNVQFNQKNNPLEELFRYIFHGETRDVEYLAEFASSLRFNEHREAARKSLLVRNNIKPNERAKMPHF